MSTPSTHDIVAVIKGLVIDATRKANSGHPGGAMSSADFAAVLFRDILKFDPNDPAWFDRDRFVLSAGHESMLLYALLHLQGFLSMDEIKNFRQLGSLTPGHPEAHLTPGVEATTGPLGQGFAMAVGMATAEAHLRGRLGEDVCSHYTYVLASDGDMQEPVSYGTASLAGLWGLDRLIVYYDANQVQLAGPTIRSDCTDYKTMYEGICWHVIEIDGHDHDAIRQAIDNAKLETTKPTLIIGNTTIAKGSASLEGSFETHGSPLSPEEIKATKTNIGLPEDQDFYCPDEVVSAFRERYDSLGAQRVEWNARLASALERPETKALWDEMWKDPKSRTFTWPTFPAGEKVATRKAWGACVMELIDQLPIMVGGSADLDPSNQTAKFRDTVGNFCAETPTKRNLSFGVREFPMGAIVNGVALHGGLVPFGATFLTFSDYCRNAIRMSALQELPIFHVFTHDSFHLGEDGPTHQPVEHLSSLRLIPNLLVLRPADAIETTKCLEIALTQEKTPSLLCLTRQGLPTLDPEHYPAVVNGPRHGGYVLKDCDLDLPEVCIIATGSEVSLALEIAKLLGDKQVRVVSMPCMELFEQQDQSYRQEVIPAAGPLMVAIEAGRTNLWHKYVGRFGLVFGIDHFGESAPAGELEKKYGFTAENLAAKIRERL